jgi:elongation factor P--(R)-beta-lysine ligase
MEAETLALCQEVVGPRPIVRYTWEEACLATLGLNPLQASREALLALPEVAGQGLGEGDFPEAADLLDFIQAHAVESRLDPRVLTVIRHFPMLQAAQSQPHPTRPDLALRFEVYGGGLELGNGYQELRDGPEYRRRFLRDLDKRKRQGKPQPLLDESLLAALEHPGLPACSGVAVGLDRLLMVAQGADSIHDVLLFPWGEH